MMQLSVADLVFAAQLRQGTTQRLEVCAVKLILTVEILAMFGDEFVEGGFRPVCTVPAGLQGGDAGLFACQIGVARRGWAAAALARPGGLLGRLAALLPLGRHRGWLRDSRASDQGRVSASAGALLGLTGRGETAAEGNASGLATRARGPLEPRLERERERERER